MKAFQKPLSTKEEQEYLKQYQNGSKAARNILIERNLRLVVHIVKKYTTLEKEAEDLISIGTIGLIKAIDTFDVKKGVRLATYASRCIDNELLMVFRNHKKQSKEIYLYEPIGADKEGNEINLLDVIESSDIDIVEDLHTKEKIAHLYDHLKEQLTEREKKIVELRYGLGQEKEVTQREIANYMGISRSYVSRIEKRALKKLRLAFECMEK